MLVKEQVQQKLTNAFNISTEALAVWVYCLPGRKRMDKRIEM